MAITSYISCKIEKEGSITIPAKILEINQGSALVEDYNQQTKQINIITIPDAKKNDWILVNADLAIQKIDQQEAQEIIKLIKSK